MDGARREEFRQLLLEERGRLLARRERLAEGLEETAGESIGELSLYDNHPADVGSETWSRGQDVGLRVRSEERLALVQEALGRLDDGSYGYCVRCGRPVEAARLRAVPETPYCRDCRRVVDAGAEMRGGEAGRPVEEEVLGPSVRTFRDGDSDGDVGTDREDAWQAVAQYGTSSSPVPPLRLLDAPDGGRSR